VQDRQIVAGVLRGDREAVAALYDGYADALHDYARRRAPTEADAADVVHDAFLVAVDRIGQLRDPERLRPWLYAIARTELHRRYRHAARFVELDGGERGRDRVEPVSQEPGPDVQVERAELVALLREATAGLADGDRELLDLHLRHGLVGADLAAAAGLPARHATVALERVKGRLARTLGVVLLSRNPTCAEFTAIRDGQPGLTPLARKRLARHVDNCPQCHREQARRMRPEVLLTAVPMLPAPPELRHRLVAARQRLADGEPPGQPPPPSWPHWDSDGFPVPRPANRRRLGMAAAAMLALLAIGGGGVLVARPLVTQQSPATPGSAAPGAPIALPGAVRTPATPATPASPTTTAAPPTTSAATTAPASRTTTRATTTTTAPTTTTPPRDSTPPVIGPASMAPEAFSTTFNGLRTCTQLPAVTATVTTTVADPSGVAAVVLTWSGPAGSGGTVTMKPTPGGGYLASVGPVPTDRASLQFGSYDLKVSMAATDTAGNAAPPRTTTFPKAVSHCGIG